MRNDILSNLLLFAVRDRESQHSCYGRGVVHNLGKSAGWNWANPPIRMNMYYYSKACWHRDTIVPMVGDPLSLFHLFKMLIFNVFDYYVDHYVNIPYIVVFRRWALEAWSIMLWWWVGRMTGERLPMTGHGKFFLTQYGVWQLKNWLLLSHATSTTFPTTKRDFLAQ